MVQVVQKACHLARVVWDLEAINPKVARWALLSNLGVAVQVECTEGVPLLPVDLTSTCRRVKAVALAAQAQVQVRKGAVLKEEAEVTLRSMLATWTLP